MLTMTAYRVCCNDTNTLFEEAINMGEIFFSDERCRHPSARPEIGEKYQFMVGRKWTFLEKKYRRHTSMVCHMILKLRLPLRKRFIVPTDVRLTNINSSNKTFTKCALLLSHRLYSNENENSRQQKSHELTKIPNILCLSRIAASPVLVYTVINEYYLASLSLFACAASTDLLDGYVARKFPDQATNLGSNLDPIADKVLIGSLVLSLTYADYFPLYLMAIMIAKDALLMAGGAWIRFRTLPAPKTVTNFFDLKMPLVKMKPTMISKVRVNTCIQFCAIAVALGSPILCYVGHPHLERLWLVQTGPPKLYG
uniref:cardiolipin synthase (CMP-forming) n=1 Tax=Romanomermis culicivorax TaxID=13658 RepID=A0A915I823_ROMCU